MKVSELISALEQCNPDATVYTWRDGLREELHDDYPVDEADDLVDINVRAANKKPTPAYWEAVRGRAVLIAAARTFLDTVGKPDLDDRDLDRLTLVMSQALGDAEC